MTRAGERAGRDALPHPRGPGQRAARPARRARRAAPGDRARRGAARPSSAIACCRARSDPAASLSYANRRRLEIARALATDPKLLLLDEPAAGMNPTEKRELMQDIARIRERGVTVLLIEHDMGLVQGDLRARGGARSRREDRRGRASSEVRRNPAVLEAYLGRRHA